MNQFLEKKEYAQLRSVDLKQSKPPGKSNSDWNQPIEEKHIGLMYKSGQRFVHNWINPNTKFDRLLLKHETGTGKTLAAISVAMEHIKYYQLNHYQEPSIFIIGFSKSIFQQELLSRKEFGFITELELAEYRRIKYIAENGTQRDKIILRDFDAKLRRRLKNKTRGGYFNFIGYKEFYNKLFIMDNDIVVDENTLYDGLSSGSIEVNWPLVTQFANSLIICDEIHNVYNSIEINKYGIALRFILNIYDIPKHMGNIFNVPNTSLYENSIIKILFLSATPINNNSAEVVDLINLLIPSSVILKKYKKIALDRTDIFKNSKLTEQGGKIIKDLVFGYVSYLSAKDPLLYPRKKMIGETIPNIKYLKFIRCPMSKKHYEIYKKNVGDTLPQTAYILTDTILPPNYFQFNDAIREYTREIPSNVELLTDPPRVSGSFMEFKNIGKYSSKYERMLQEIFNNIKNNGGKIYINHQMVKGSGVYFIEQLLIRNGIIDEFSSPTKNTICNKCGVIFGKHGDSHKFLATRFISIHGEIDKKIVESSLSKYNNISNLNGQRLRIMIGSEMTNEGIDLKAVRNIYIMTIPNDISTLIQIFGRGIRNKSHIELPEENRLVKIFIFVSSIPKEKSLSYEERKYKEKISEYLIIQQIEKILNEEAIDSLIHERINKISDKIPELGALHFNHTKKLTIPKHIDLSSFHFFVNDEIVLIVYIIKRLFMEQSDMWKINDLWELVKNPPFDISINTEMFDHDNFNIAIDHLLWKKDFNPYNIKTPENNLMDFNQTYIYTNSYKTIVMIDDYLLLVPLISFQGNIDQIDERRKYVKLGTSSAEVNGIPNVKLGNVYKLKSVINITKSLKQLNISYPHMKLKFFEQYRKIPIQYIPTSFEIYDIEFHKRIIQDAITYAFNIMVNKDMPFSELHEFYFKMLYFYDRLDMIVFANNLIEYNNLFDNYKKYTTLDEQDKNHNSFMMTSMIKSVEPLQRENFKNLNKYLRNVKSKKANDQSDWQTGIKIKTKEEYMTIKINKPKNINKVLSRMLPVGHFVGLENITPYLYEPETNSWELAESVLIMSDPINQIENDLIIGYYQKSHSSLEMHMKLRLPKQQQKSHRDMRFIERGTTCTSKNKKELEEVLKMLNIKGTHNNSKKICNLIKYELMKRELDERRKYKHDADKRIRWFYMQFETQL